MWSVAGVREALHVVAACGLASLVQIAGMMLLQLSVPRSFFLVSFAALCAEELGIRLSYRVVISLFGNHSKKAAKRIMIVGAGTSGSVILKEMTTSSLVNGCVVCFVDDDKNKAGGFALFAARVPICQDSGEKSSRIGPFCPMCMKKAAALFGNRLIPRADTGT